MKKFLKMLVGIIVLLLAGSSAYSAFKKPKELKRVKKAIKDNKSQEKEIQAKLDDLEKDRKSNKTEIKSLKAELNKINKQVDKAETVYKKDDVKAATAFLKKIGSGNA